MPQERPKGMGFFAMDKRDRINKLLKILNQTGTELKELVPDSESSFRQFKDKLEMEYWRNNQLTLF